MTPATASPPASAEFQFLNDTIVVRTAASDTDGAYTVLDWTAAADFAVPTHSHEAYDETFVMLNGTLDITMGAETTTLTPGQSLHVPKGARHSYRTPQDSSARILLIIRPAGLEELFYRHRTDSEAFDFDAYLKDAKNEFGTEYSLA
ncbi:MAG: cupin domain-containing protein [Pseudomonadota bacterium]